MTDEIYYLRLNTGDEIIGRVIEENPNTFQLILDNPLKIEVSEDNDSSMIFFSRYNPYSNDTSIAINMTSIVLFQTASDVVSDYYIKSVDFCKSYIDKQFKKGIASATSYVDKVLKQLAIDGQVTEDTPDTYTESDDFIEEQEGDSNQKPPTVH